MEAKLGRQKNQLMLQAQGLILGLYFTTLKYNTIQCNTLKIINKIKQYKIKHY